MIRQLTKTRSFATAERPHDALVSKFVVFHEMWEFVGVRKVSNSKSDLHGHSKALVMVSLDRPHTISIVALELCLYFAPLTRYYHLFSKM